MCPAQLSAHLLLRTLTMPAWGSSLLSMWQVKMQWLREEAAFMSVAATWRFCVPSCSTARASDTAGHMPHSGGSSACKPKQQLQFQLRLVCRRKHQHMAAQLPSVMRLRQTTATHSCLCCSPLQFNMRQSKCIRRGLPSSTTLSHRPSTYTPLRMSSLTFRGPVPGRSRS